MLNENRGAHLNLVESSRQLFEMDPGAEIESGAGWVFGAGRSPHPAISNAAFRTDDELDPIELIRRARKFFAERGRGFAIWARSGAEDEDLTGAADAAGLQRIYSMPEMTLGSKVAERPAPDGLELRRVESEADARGYWQVAASAYQSIGFPPEVFSYYEGHTGFAADNLAAFLGLLDGEPAGIAMTIVSHDVAGIYWVGATERARGRRLGSTMTAAAVNAGFDLGAEIASLQASPMGENLYRRMGFETIYDYRLLLSSPPEARG